MVNRLEMDGVIQQPEHEMLSTATDFGELVVCQVSIPHTEFVAVEANAFPDEALLEKIVGEVLDGFETTRPTIQPLGNEAALVDGMATIEGVSKYFGLNLVEEYYDTIAGYVLRRPGCISPAGDNYFDRKNGIHLKVEKMDNLRIAQILINRQE